MGKASTSGQVAGKPPAQKRINSVPVDMHVKWQVHRTFYTSSAERSEGQQIRPSPRDETDIVGQDARNRIAGAVARKKLETSRRSRCKAKVVVIGRMAYVQGRRCCFRIFVIFFNRRSSKRAWLFRFGRIKCNNRIRQGREKGNIMTCD